MLACNELAFVLHPLPLALPNSVATFIYTKLGKGSTLLGHTRRALHVAAAIAFGLGFGAVAAWMLLASAVLWIIVMALVACAPLTITFGEETHVFNVCSALHLGVLNWLLDIPGAGSKTTYYTHIITIAANIAAASAIVLGLTLAPGLARAWSCYPTIPISGLNSGTCASNFNVCPGDSGVSCPDYSRPACALALADSCGTRDIHDATAHGLEPYATVGKMIAAASISIYATATFKRSAAFVKTALAEN